MKKLFSTIFIVIFIFTAFILFNDVSASSNNSIEIHNKTKVNSEEYSSYRNSAPSITILTHGLGGQDFHWSNSITNSGSFDYNAQSIINKIKNELNGEVSIYIAEAYSDITYDSEYRNILDCVYDEYKLFKITNYNSQYTSACKVQTDFLDDVSKHIILLFDSNISSSTHENVYEQFHKVVDDISYQYKQLTGVLPRLNLVGHSRGGIINLMYAIDHMYNIDSIYSMGTPYNGSTLGLINPILEDMLGYYLKDSNNNPYLNARYAGVEDIMDEQTSVQLRNAWNSAYTEDVEINVVVYGSITTIDFLRELVEEVATNTIYNKYQPAIQQYQDLLNTIINVMDTVPITSYLTLNFINGLAQIVNAFGVDVYDEIFTNIDSSLEGDITAEEVDDILSLINVINGEVVVMDDLFIDTNSQLGLGFSDGNSYNGFKRYVKFFEETDLSSNCAIPDLPPIPHNLETMSNLFINNIVSSLDYGSHTLNATNLIDNSSNNHYINETKVFNFECNYSAERTISAENCEIDVYYYEDVIVNNEIKGKVLKKASSTTHASFFTYEFTYDENYLILISRTTSGNTNVSFRIEDNLLLGTNPNVELNAKEHKAFSINVTQTGYYVITIANTSLTCDNGTQYDSSKFYIYFSAGENVIYLSNISNYVTSGTVNIETPSQVPVGQSFSITSANRILSFTNNYGNPLNFEIQISWTSTPLSVVVYNEENNFTTNIVTGVVSSSGAVYTFSLNEGESCVLLFNQANINSSAVISLPDEQLAWKINGNLCSSVVSLPRGYYYEITLWSLVDNNYYEVDCDLGFPVAANETYTHTGNIVYIYSGSGTDHFAVTCSIAFGFSLSITVEDDFIINVSSRNEQSIATITYSTNKLNCVIKGYYQNSSGKHTLTWNASSSSIETSVKNYVFISGTPVNTTFVFDQIIYNGFTYTINNKIEYLLDVRFNGGTGTINNPYIVNCQRHLNNVRNFTSSYFKQTASITLTGTWNPILYFYGTYDGNNKTINNLKLNVTSNDADYGLFGYVYGTVKNLTIYSITVSKTLSSQSNANRSHVGSICAYVVSNGTVTNCHLNYGTFNADVYQLTAGGITGVNFGTVSNCSVNDVNMYVSGRAGGIVGENSGSVSSCAANDIEITHYWFANTFTGGIVGFNTSSGSLSGCSSSGVIIWDSPEKGDHIYPSMGYIIGYNAGSYSNCTTTMEKDIDYYSQIIGWYNQSKYCFKEDNGKVGQEV